MIKLTYYDYKEEDSVFYISKDNIGDMNRCEDVTWIYTKGREPATYRAKETPEEILAMPDIETTEKVIDWEQRRYEIAKMIFPLIYQYGERTDAFDYARETMMFTEALISELKKGQDNEN